VFRAGWRWLCWCGTLSGPGHLPPARSRRPQPANPMQSDRMFLTTAPGRVFAFGLLLIASLLVYRAEFNALARLALNDDRYTYVAAVPLASFGLLLLKRKAILSASRYCLSLGMPLLAAGIAIATVHDLSTAIFGIVIIWMAGFILVFGPAAFRIGRFPVLLLFLTIPIPAPALDRITTALQDSSAYMSAILFKALRVPVLRQGLVFSLPGFDIQIAPQCSGIRSSMALVIASGLAAYLFLRTTAHRLLLVLVTVPLVIFKNAVRIVTLSTLALYVNQGFLHGSLHHYGGLCFSLLDLAIVAPLLLQFHKRESRTLAPWQNALQ
jgi:exosortase